MSVAKIYLFSLSLMIAVVSCSQPQSKNQEVNQKDIIDTIVKQFKSDYVFPEVAEKIGEHLYVQLEKEVYVGLDSKEFAAQLTEDMRSIAHDKHIRINYIERDAEKKPTNSLRDIHKRFKTMASKKQKYWKGTSDILI